MRITGGTARGHNLKVPKVSDLRPAQDMVRQAIFNILDSRQTISDKRVLDLYAGTGSFGLEALSRGAATATFVDNKRRVCDVIQENLNHSHFLGRGKVVCRDAERFVKETPPYSYDFIFLSPPYALTPRAVLLQLAEILKDNGVIIYEHDSRVVLSNETRELLGESLEVLDTRKYGKTVVSFLQKKTH
ncbi:MAG: 16S rRNA (guanine(966)-N(2))-methyltransferase RsmD [Candidatus Cloacimonetes bacterium]|nr:16S rRNA (guanine(966)-N(2))-methyltransferase RsmD [Candidatus Cloacimonadota bacterium]